MTYTVSAKICECIPGLKLSTLQYVSIYHDQQSQRCNRLVYTMTETVNVTIGEYIA